MMSEKIMGKVSELVRHFVLDFVSALNFWLMELMREKKKELESRIIIF